MFCTLSHRACQLLLPHNYQIEKFLLWKAYLSVMAQSQQRCFKGRLDNYNGVIVNSTDEPCEASEFSQRLKDSLQEWTKDKKNTVWFNVHVAQADWIPILTRERFKFHHARDENVTLHRWLSDEVCNIPPYAHTNIGIGAFVYNEKNGEILVVKEKGVTLTMWKLPGGFIEPKENLDKAVEREVFEETGIRAKFECLLSFRHCHESKFGSSDMYFIARLQPSTYDITTCTQEISECVWMKLEEFAEHPEVHSNNRFFAQGMLEHLKTNVGFKASHTIHPTFKKPVCLFRMSKISDD